ncbi:hypothetical protein PsYK624_135690 [Phanerochaete sordida]|uniref:Uncharacterized protein n=1 Tax=Phanerochaete sordida TaxID=48140 RepID=A0A9P3GK35_9APHY|nr:hypothetical protein PsYK624_135690 [Phanerochaete sordida]
MLVRAGRSGLAPWESHTALTTDACEVIHAPARPDCPPACCMLPVHDHVAYRYHKSYLLHSRATCPSPRKRSLAATGIQSPVPSCTPAHRADAIACRPIVQSRG